jgi:hypothetical protein
VLVNIVTARKLALKALYDASLAAVPERNCQDARRRGRRGGGGRDDRGMQRRRSASVRIAPKIAKYRDKNYFQRLYSAND